MKKLLSVLALALLTMGGIAHSQPRGPALAMMEAVKSMPLSKTDRDQIRKWMVETRKAVIPLRAELDLAKTELYELMSSDEIQEETLMKAVDRVASSEAAVRKRQLSTFLKVRGLLTPEQREALQATMLQFKANRPGRKQQMMQRGQGR